MISMAIFNSCVSTILWVGKNDFYGHKFNSYVSTILWVGKINDFYGHKFNNYGKSPFLMGKSTINGHFQ